MKIKILIALFIVTGSTLFGQDPSFNFNCNTDFFTTTFDGFIQQWSLNNGTITGGDTILSGGGTSLSFCGASDTPTFYSNDWSTVGVRYYDPGSGWITIPTGEAIDNGGGHGNDIYYKVEGAVIQIVKYWDGTNLSTVDFLDGEFFAGTHDIAVDTLGQAWVFTGSVPWDADSIKVYNQNGQIQSYSVQFDQTAHGSFFLNDTLYIGTGENTIYPVVIDGDEAVLGNAIPFASNNFTDMASCQRAEMPNSVGELSNPQIKLYPNPTDGFVVIDGDLEGAQVSVFSSAGQFIDVEIKDGMLDLGGYPAGVYFVRIRMDVGLEYYKVVKF